MNDIPKWRKDFPIQWGADHYITRRDFTRFLILTSGATFVGNSYFVVQKYLKRSKDYPTTKAADVGEVPVGGVKLFRYPTENDPALLLRLAEDRYVAFAQRCTHLSCPVHYSAETRRLECPCHNGAFDAATGAVLEGPPPRPLPRIRLQIVDGAIFAKGFDES